MKPEDLKINLGFEWELEYNSNLFSIDTAPYHSDEDEEIWVTDRIKAEEDGSLDALTFYDEEDEEIGGTAELITKKINIDNYKSILDEFQNYIVKKSGTDRLSQAISFNKSTGAHLHFSVIARNHNMIPLKMIPAQIFLDFNEKLLEKFKENFSEEKYNTFKKYFYRSFSLRTESKQERYASINFTCSENNHLEFRSFHLRHCENWEDFYKSYDILIPLLKEFIVTNLIKKKLKYSLIKSLEISEKTGLNPKVFQPRQLINTLTIRI